MCVGTGRIVILNQLCNNIKYEKGWVSLWITNYHGKNYYQVSV